MIKFNGENLELEYKEYNNGNLAVLVFDSDGLPYARLSVNTDYQMEENEFVLNHDLYNEMFMPLIAKLYEKGLIEFTGKKVSYGFCKDIPVYKALKVGK